MILSTNLVGLQNVFGVKDTIDVLAKVGFAGVDFCNDREEFYTAAHDKAFYTNIKNYAHEKEIAIAQAHAPFPSSFVEEDKTAQRFEEIVQSMRNAAYLGAPMIVVHPCVHLDFEEEGNAEKLFEINLDFYRRLAPYAEELGIQIAIENIKRVSITSQPERLNRLYDTLNSPVFTICFDVGHCLLQGVDPATAVRALGARLVNGCTHIHDNGGELDEHTLPYYGNVDWEGVMQALAEIGYQGTFNYEAAGFFRNVPPELRPDALAYMAAVGRHLIGKFERYKADGKSVL